MPSIEIESMKFTTRLGIAGDLDSFIALLGQQPELKELSNGKTPQAAAELISSRINDLLAAEFDQKYRNPHDTALAAYLYTLHNIRNAYSAPYIAKFIRRPDLWWARRLALHLRPFELTRETLTQSTKTRGVALEGIVWIVPGGHVPNVRSAIHYEAYRRGHAGEEWVSKVADFVDYAFEHHAKHRSDQWTYDVPAIRHRNAEDCPR